MLRAGILLLLLSAGVSTAVAEPYLDTLLQESARLDLADDPYWHKLGHYVGGPFGGVRSAAKGDGFLLAEEGGKDPRAELEATLAAFFQPPLEGEEQHPQCRFIARYHWLAERLDFDEARLPAVACPEFDEWYEAIDPERITLIFASAYVNNPASMYGHTLLRFDQPGGEDSGQLAAYALNYTANTAETSGLVFAVLGISGGYLGQFSLLPYYDKVQDYNALESRDLWEYELTLNRVETVRMLWHTWELRGIGFRYYFFKQNCSYRLLELLELARPGLELTNPFRVWAIPTDTVRTVLETEGVLSRVRFRPGAATALRHHLDALSRESQELTRELALGRRDADDAEFTALAIEERARVLEIAYEYLHYLTLNGRVPKEDTAPRLRALLVARSAISVAPQLKPLPTPAVRPDQAHATSRASVGFGRWDGQPFRSIRWRAAYHGQLDPQPGYQENAQINFLDVEARQLVDDDTFRLERLTLIDIDSLTARDKFFSSMSWNVRFGFRRQRLPDGRWPMVTEVAGGAAWAYRVRGGSRSIVYGGLKTSLQLGHELPRSWRIGAGPQLGLLADWGAAGRFRIEGRSLWMLNESRPQWQVFAEHRLPLTRSLAIGARASREEIYEARVDEVGAMLFIYY